MNMNMNIKVKGVADKLTERVDYMFPKWKFGNRTTTLPLPLIEISLFITQRPSSWTNTHRYRDRTRHTHTGPLDSRSIRCKGKSTTMFCGVFMRKSRR